MRQRVGGHVGADDRLPRDGAAYRIVDGRAEQRRGGGLAARELEVDAERPEQRVVGVGEHVEQMRDRRAGIAADVTDAGLQQRLRDGENALAPEDLAFPVAELLDVLGERALTHRSGAGRLGGSVATALVGHAFALLVPDRVAARMKEDGEGTTEIELVFRRGTDDLAAARAGLGHAGPRP